MFSRRGPSGCRGQLSRPLLAEGRGSRGAQLLSTKPYGSKSLPGWKVLVLERNGSRPVQKPCCFALPQGSSGHSWFGCCPAGGPGLWPCMKHHSGLWKWGAVGWHVTFRYTLCSFFLISLLRSLKTVHHLVCREMQQETKQVSPVWIGMAPEVK